MGVLTWRAAGWQLTRRAVSLSGLDRQVFTLFFLWCAADRAWGTGRHAYAVYLLHVQNAQREIKCICVMACSLCVLVGKGTGSLPTHRLVQLCEAPPRVLPVPCWPSKGKSTPSPGNILRR